MAKKQKSRREELYANLSTGLYCARDTTDMVPLMCSQTPGYPSVYSPFPYRFVIPSAVVSAAHTRCSSFVCNPESLSSFSAASQSGPREIFSLVPFSGHPATDVDLYSEGCIFKVPSLTTRKICFTIIP